MYRYREFLTYLQVNIRVELLQLVGHAVSLDASQLQHMDDDDISLIEPGGLISAAELLHGSIR